MVYTNRNLEKEMSSTLAPVIVFAYNRPDHLRKVLESLESNKESAQSELYIYCDGPKSGASGEAVKQIEAVRAVAREKNWCGTVHVIAAESNRGLADSVIGGVEDVLANHGKTIVLEDDAVCSPYFLEYMNSALDLYVNNEEVVSVAGYLYPFETQLPDTFFLRGADCIAWATWQRGWKYFRYDASLLLSDIEQCGTKDHFEFNHSYPYVQMLRDQVEGKIDSWAIRWYASAYLAGKYTLYPGKSMVRNIGFDGSGINSGVSEKWETGIVDFHPRVELIPVAENDQARQAIEQFFRELRKTPINSRVKQAIWSRLPGFIRKVWSGKSGSEVYGWHGDYPDWTSAKNASGGYNSQAITDKVFAAALEVKKGNAFAERDGILFQNPEFPEQTLHALQKSVDTHDGRLHLIDFGGGPGSSYFLYKKLLKNVKEIYWHVVEQAQFYERGNKELADESLAFFATPEHAQLELQPDVLLLSSVLQYIENPKEMLQRLITPEVATIIIETTPFVHDTQEHITVQRVPPHIYEASYPSHLFVEEKFLGWFRGFEVQQRYLSKAVEPRLINGRKTQWLGFVLCRANQS